MLSGILILACWLFLGIYWNLSARPVKPAAVQQDWGGRLARTPVWLGYLILLACGIYPHGPMLFARSGPLGVAVCTLGLALSLWARRTLGRDWSQDVELKQGHALVERGPYAYVRHPIYTGHLLMALGTAIATGLALAFAAVLLFFIGFRIKLQQEESLLSSQLAGYSAYKARVKALVPYLY